MERKPKGVTTEMKALDEYIPTALFILLLKRVRFIAFFHLFLQTNIAMTGSGAVCACDIALRTRDSLLNILIDNDLLGLFPGCHHG